MTRATGFAASAVFATFTSQAHATGLDLTCSGDALNWRIALHDMQAKMTLIDVADMDVMDDTAAMGQDWPRALTLVGDRNTAILILDPRNCGVKATDYAATVLTQQGQTPILLTGCCVANE